MSPLRPVWIGAGNVAHTWIRSPDRPSPSESQYGPSYSGRQSHVLILSLTGHILTSHGEAERQFVYTLSF